VVTLGQFRVGTNAGLVQSEQTTVQKHIWRENFLFSTDSKLTTTSNMAPPRPRGTEKNKHAVEVKAKKPKKQPKERPQDHAPKREEIPQELQQLLLNVFRHSFDERLRTDLQPLLQEVKGHLFNRDFGAAFGKDEYLEAYAARWSPSRVLGFLQVFWDLRQHILSSVACEETDSGTKTSMRKKIICLGGGGGAEIVAWGGFMNALQADENLAGQLKSLEVLSIDIANWTSVIETLYNTLTTVPPISKYASVAAQAANVRLVDPETFTVKPHQLDILNIDFGVLRPLLQDATLITIMFTLNELYSTSLSLTQKFLLQFTAAVEPGTLLLVGDSPGSYSTVRMELGGDGEKEETEGKAKQYPMQWLLDRTLLRLGPKGEDSQWVKVEEEESRWYRMREELKYPIELENMRFQVHLYKRV